MVKPRIINSTSIGNTKRDNTRVASKQPIKIKLTPEQIAALLHKTSASIRYLISTFESRKNTNKMIAIYLQNIRKSLANEC